MKNTVLILLLLIIITSFSQEIKNKNAKATFEVNGNCEQCKKRIEKAAYAVSGVKMAIWDVNSHQLNVILNEEKTSIADLKRAIAKVGHDNDAEKTTIETYDKLPNCCKYERK